MKTFKLHYHVSNGGDGSANVRFHATQAQAVKADEGQSEGWGESSAGKVALKVEDGKLYRSGSGYLDKDGNLVDEKAPGFNWRDYKYGSAWIEIPAD